jgi:hypothetical protein
MTIYCLEMSSDNLGKLPNTQILTNLCLQICEGILNNYLRVLWAHNPATQQVIAKQITLLQWYLGMLGRATSDYSEVSPTLDVNYIYIEKKISLATPPLKVVITLNTLSDVCPKLLLEVMHKLLEDSLACLTTHLHSMPSEQLNDCRHRIMAITRDLSNSIGTLPSINRPGIGRLIYADFKSVILRFQVHDQKNEVKSFL